MVCRLGYQGFQLGVQGLALGLKRIVVVYHFIADSGTQASRSILGGAVGGSQRRSTRTTGCFSHPLGLVSPGSASTGRNGYYYEERLHLDPTRRGSTQRIEPLLDGVNQTAENSS